MNEVSRQLEIVLRLSEEFKEMGFEYHFDGSTSKVLQGAKANMNDIDIVFPYSRHEKIKEYFINRNLSEESWDSENQLLHFYFTENKEKVHLLFYKNSEDSFHDYHEQIDVNGTKLWVKGLGFFG